MKNQEVFPHHELQSLIKTVKVLLKEILKTIKNYFVKARRESMDRPGIYLRSDQPKVETLVNSQGIQQGPQKDATLVTG